MISQPPQRTPGHELKAALLLGFVTLLAHVWIWWPVRSAPCQDLPFHLAAAELIARARDSQLSYFSANDIASRPNTLFEFVVSWLPDPAAAGSGWIIVLVTAMLVLVIAVAVRRGGNPVLALPAVIYCYNMNFSVGLVGFCLGIVATLSLIWLLSGISAAPSKGTWIAIVAVTVLAFYVHVFAFAMCVAVIIVWVLIRPERAGRTRLLLALTPAIALAAIWYIRESEMASRDMSYLKNYYTSVYLRELPKRFALLAVVDHRHWSTSTAAVIAISALAWGLVGLSASRLLEIDRAIAKRYLRSPLGALLLVATVASLVLPPAMTAHHFLYQRFACYLAIALTLLGASVPVPRKRHDNLVRGGMALALAAHAVLVGNYAREFDRYAQPGRELIREAVASGGAMAGMLDGVSFRGREIMRHFQDYYIVEGGSATVSSLSDFRLRIVEKTAADSVLPRRLSLGKGIPYNDEYRDVEHILFIATPSSGAHFLMVNRLVQRRGAWALASKVRAEGPTQKD